MFFLFNKIYSKIWLSILKSNNVTYDKVVSLVESYYGVNALTESANLFIKEYLKWILKK